MADDRLPDLLLTEAAKNPQPDLHIRGDKEVRYERVAQAMAAPQKPRGNALMHCQRPTAHDETGQADTD